jgi:hypothetical protein
MSKVYLSRRNLLTLINKLDRNKVEPGASKCTLVKRDDKHPFFPQSEREITVVAVEDDLYYCERSPGTVHPKDVPK